MVCIDYKEDCGHQRNVRQQLRSTGDRVLQVPRPSARFGDCSFSVTLHAAWNSLPDHVKNAPSLEPFNHNSRPIFLNNHMTVIDLLNSCTAPYPSASALLR